MPKGIDTVHREFGGSEKTDPSVKLSELLVEPSQNYQELIEQNDRDVHLEEWRSGELNIGHDHSTQSIFEGQTPEKEELIHFIRNRLQGEIIVDLGGGSGQMVKFALRAGAKAFINVNKYPEHHEDDPIDATKPRGKVLDTTWEKLEGKRIEHIDVKADMLDFLSRLPDNSVNITLNGIDECMLRNQQYIKAVVKEIGRVTKEGGLVLGRSSEPLSILKYAVQHPVEGEEVGFTLIDTKKIAGSLADVVILVKNSNAS